MVAFNNIIISSILAIAAMAAPAVLDQESSSSSLVRRKNTNKCEAHIHIDCKSKQPWTQVRKTLTTGTSFQWTLWQLLHYQVQHRPSRQRRTCPAYGQGLVLGQCRYMVSYKPRLPDQDWHHQRSRALDRW